MGGARDLNNEKNIIEPKVRRPRDIDINDELRKIKVNLIQEFSKIAGT